MPQVNVAQPTNLMEMFQSPSAMLWDIASNNQKQYQQANNLNMQQAQQSMDFDKQKQPYELQKLFNDNARAQAELPGIQADSGLKQNNWKISNDTMDEQTKAARSKLLSGISDDEVKQAQDQIKQMAMSANPQIAAYGKKLMEGFSDFQKELMSQREHRTTAYGVAGMNNSTQMALEDKRIEAGKYKKSDKYGLSFSQRLDVENDPRKKLGMLVEAAQMASQEGDMEAAQQFRARAEALQPLVQQMIAGQKPGGVDINTLTQGQVPTVPAQPVVPNVAPKQSSATQYQAGQTYRGKTGTYQFVGGDPNNKANWRKVE